MNQLRVSIRVPFSFLFATSPSGTTFRTTAAGKPYRRWDMARPKSATIPQAPSLKSNYTTDAWDRKTHDLLDTRTETKFGVPDWVTICNPLDPNTDTKFRVPRDCVSIWVPDELRKPWSSDWASWGYTRYRYDDECHVPCL
ncbi:hypothetical protein DFH09DRAFT_248558 [Mycena vulgaris]|nr:hypothetical protein DFH09DRAFT_248558 [Mycena vulgaris]